MKLFGKSKSTSEAAVEEAATEEANDVVAKDEVTNGVPSEQEDEEKEGFWMLIEEAFELVEKGCVVVGRVAGARVHKNQKVIIRRQNGDDIETTVDGIEVYQQGLQESVDVGMTVGIKLEGVSKEQITKGDRMMSMVSEAFLSTIKDAEKLYVLYLTKTGLPLIVMQCAEVFTTEEYAINGLEHYKENYPDIEVKEIPAEGCDLTAGLPLFWYLTYLGVGEVVIDDGVAGVMVSREALAGEKEKIYQEEEEESVTNTGLRMQMNSFIGQLENKIHFDGSEEMLKSLEAGVVEGIRMGIFLMASQDEETIALLSDHEGNKYVPVFTDRLEFDKIFTNGDWSKRVSTFTEVSAIASRCTGMVINPLGENMTLTNDMLQKLCEAQN